MERPSPLISWVNPFPSIFINRTIFFCNALAACCHFSIFIGSFLYQRAKPSQGIVLLIDLLGKGLTPRACTGDAGSIWWVPACLCFKKLFLIKILRFANESRFRLLSISSPHWQFKKQRAYQLKKIILEVWVTESVIRTQLFSCLQALT